MTPRNDGSDSDVTPRNDGSDSDVTPRNDGSDSDVTPRKDGSDSHVTPRNDGSDTDVTPRNDGSDSDVTPRQVTPRNDGGDMLPRAVQKLMNQLCRAASKRDWERLEPLLAERFTFTVEVKRQPRARAIEHWKTRDPDALSDLVELVDARDHACKHYIPVSGARYVECQLPDVSHRMVIEHIEDGWVFNRLIAGD